MQAQERKLVPAVIFDSSIEDEIGHVLALAMLLGYGARREVRVASLSVSRNNLRIAAFCELMSRFYGASSTIGMASGGAALTTLPPMLQAVLEKQTPEGTPSYTRTIDHLNDTADPVALIRNAFTAQQDQNAVVILAGPPANLRGILALPEGKQLIQKKVRALVVVAPFEDLPGMSRLLEDWPSPVIFADEELGRLLSFPAASIEQDFAWTASHPLVDAYRAARPMPYDAPASAMAAALYAAHPDESYFMLSEPRVMQVMAGGAKFTANPRGSHRQLMVDAAAKERVVNAYRQIVSTKPPEPRRGGRGPQA
jgi:hypothetical protein